MAKGGKGYWEAHQHKYPFQVEVVHMSEQDPDPRKIGRLITFHFIRVPFGDGTTHWGFQYQSDMDLFKRTFDIP